MEPKELLSPVSARFAESYRVFWTHSSCGKEKFVHKPNKISEKT